MSDIIRFGVSLEKELLEKFDKLSREKQYLTARKQLEI